VLSVKDLEFRMLALSNEKYHDFLLKKFAIFFFLFFFFRNYLQFTFEISVIECRSTFRHRTLSTVL
jgi:hypothetical protein